MVKSFQELMLTQDAENELIKEQVYDIIKDAADAVSVAPRLATFVNLKQGSSLKFVLQTKDSMNVRQIAPGAEVPIDVENYTEIEVVPQKYGIRPLITTEMIEDANWDVVDRNLRYAGRKMGLKRDSLIISAYDDANEGFPSQNAVTETNSELTISSIVEAMKEVEQEDYKPTLMLMHPKQVMELRKIDTFVEADKAGVTDPSKGFIGRIYGLDCIITTEVTADKVYIFDPAEAGVFVVRRPITIEKYADPIRGLVGCSITARWAAKCLRPKAGARIAVS